MRVLTMFPIANLSVHSNFLANMNLKEFSFAQTPTCGVNWVERNDASRELLVTQLIAQYPAWAAIMQIHRAQRDGQVIVKFLVPLGAQQRGTLLLDFEVCLKQHLDIGLSVWLEPLEDHSSLRRLRGVEVKK